MTSAASRYDFGAASRRWPTLIVAMVMIAHLIAGKTAARALFLSCFQVNHLLWVLASSAVLTVFVLIGMSWAQRRYGPARLVPAAFLASAVVHAVEWTLLGSNTQRVAAVLLTLHIALVPVLISGFWALLSEGNDPRANRRQMSRVAVACSVGGVIGGLLAWKAGSASMLPLLVIMHVFCGAAIALIGRYLPPDRAGPGATEADSARVGEMLRGRDVLRATPYLRWLAFSALLMAASAALLEAVFSAQVQSALPSRVEMQSMLSAYYASTSVLALGVQLFLAPLLLRVGGLVPTLTTLPAGTLLGCLAAIGPLSLPFVVAARGMEHVVRNSIFRSAYEQLFVAVPPWQKNASKSIIDVGFDRGGDLLGYGLGLALLHLSVFAGRAQLAIAALLAGGALLLMPRIHRLYQAALLKNLDDGVVTPPSDISDLTTLRVLRQSSAWRPPAPARDGRLVFAVAGLESDDPSQIRRVFHDHPTIDRALVGHVIPLLGRDDLVDDVTEALRRVATENVGQLLDVLRDDSVDPVVRRRIPRVLSGCNSTTALNGLFEALSDQRFELRLRCGHALARMHRSYPDLPMEQERVISIVLRELEIQRTPEAAAEGPHDLPGFALDVDHPRGMAPVGLKHVFNLLSLMCPREPLLKSYQALQSDDPSARGHAIDYLESILHRRIRDRLLALLEPGT